jgi:uncharacterized LabA/DUF88 family protein
LNIMDTNNDRRIALFIDGPNFFNTAKGLKFEVDFKRLLTAFERRGLLLRAFYYTPVNEGLEYTSIRPLLDWLEYNGFTLRTKPAKTIEDGDGQRMATRMDIELTIDAIEIASYVEEVFIFSGDGNFLRLVTALQRRGVRVSIVSSTLTAPSMVAGDLRRQANEFIELNRLRTEIERSRTA